eukprot:GFUD01001165.1.p1 GENE.GFUD01001165.1~~GFUD01001165.1.p1  ORF type:complete len:928 (+),score=299.75 GFUD01001165.1:196-2979(+)
MDLETFSILVGAQFPVVPGDDTLDHMDTMHVKVTRVEDENLSVVLPGLLESELHTANVVLLLDNKTSLKAHKCFLSASPVLKEVLMSLEARLDKLPHISMPEFSKESVVSFLHFLYKGFVVLENNNNQQEFLRLCTTLKVNPPVVRVAGKVPDDTCSQELVLPSQAFSDLSDDEMVIEEDFEEVQEQETEPEVEKDTNSNLLLREPHIVDKSSDIETDSVPDSLLSVKDTNLNNDNLTMVECPSNRVLDELTNIPESSSLPSQNLEIIPNHAYHVPALPDQQLGSICDNLGPLASNDSLPVYESLANLKSPTEDEYDDETTEHISDFLNLLNTKSLNEKKAKEEIQVEPEQEMEPVDTFDTFRMPDSFDIPVDTFKMPDSFDIPSDYIKEIVPYSSASSASFQISDDEIDRKPAEIIQCPVQVPIGNLAGTKENEKKVEESKIKEEPVGEKRIIRNLNFDDDIFKEEFIDNTPVQDEIEQITYKKDETSRRYRDSNKPQQKKVHNPKKDRRKMISSLFSESDEELPSTISKKLSFKDSGEPRAVTPSSEESRTPTPTTSLRDELEEKRERMKKKLKRSGGGDVEDPRVLEYRKKKKQMQESTPRKNHSSGSTPSKVHTCNSSCMCVKNIRHEEDNKWLVPDTYESSDELIGKHSESDESSDIDKPDQSSSQKKKKIHKKRIIPAEDSSDEESDEEENAEDRRKRLDERKKRKGGDVLAWMSRKARVSVSVQTKPKAVILDMALYKMKLLAEDGTDESDHEVKEPTGKQSDSGSEDSIPRGKRFSPVKLPESEEEMKKPKKKIKKHKKKRKRIRKATPEPSFPVEDVVWTPAMYEKWDKNRGKKKGSDSDSDAPRSKHKKLHRSMSTEPKPSIDSYKHKSSQLPKVQRSMSSLESLGISHNYGPSSMSKPASSLPKIPKLKKPDSGKL